MDKGAGIRALLDGTGMTAALYAGDDATDLDAFRALEGLEEEGVLRAILRVGVGSEEGPAAITEDADLVVEGPDGVARLLAALEAG
jgi:trehalose 6-phosphate phosphatase